jgi:hypothetical protein
MVRRDASDRIPDRHCTVRSKCVGLYRQLLLSFGAAVLALILVALMKASEPGPFTPKPVLPMQRHLLARIRRYAKKYEGRHRIFARRA